MRIPRRVGGAFAALAVVATGALAADLDPTIVTQLTNPTDGIWVPVDVTGEVVRVDAASGEVTARVDVAADGARLDLREKEDELVVVDRSKGDVLAVDPALQRVDRRVSTGLAGTDFVDISADAAVLGGATQIARVGADVTSSRALVAPEPVNSLVATGDGAAAGYAGGVAGLGPDGNEIIELEDAEPMVARVGDVVVYPDAGVMRSLDGTRRSCIGATPEPGAKWAGDDGSRAAVADGERGTVQIIDIEAGWCRTVELVEPGTQLGTPAIALGVVFVPEPEAGLVHIVDPNGRGEPVRVAVSFGGSRLQIHTRDTIVVAHNPLTSVGALLDADGVVRPIDTSPADRGISAVLGESGTALQGDPEDEGEGSSGGGTAPGEVEAPEGSPAIDPSVLAAVVENPAEVGEPAPSGELSARFAFSSDVVTVGEVALFVDESTGSPTSWLWDFGDGTGASGPSVEKRWDTAGTYTVTLFVERGTDRDQVSVAILVVPEQTALPPSADFSFSTTVVEVGQPVDFVDRTSGRVDRRRWEFGDGSTSQEASPSKSWAAPGRYTVTLTVANDLGSDSAAIVIEVVRSLQPPVAVIDADIERLEAGEALAVVGRSDGGPAEFEWDFGDGTSAVGSTVIHVYDEPGTYTIQLTASNDAGVSEAELVVEVLVPTMVPVARIAALPEVIEVGVEVTLTSLATNDPDTETWSFGDGSPLVEGTVVQHVWTEPGTYLVTLTARNRAGVSAPAVLEVTVLAELPPPVAGIIAPTENPRVGELVLFLDDSQDATAWSWNFGDGTAPDPSRDPLHRFTSPGEKTVTLTVSNRNGTSTATAKVTVLPALPVADFVFTPAVPQVGEPVQFTDASSNATSWAWDFGDGTTSTDRNPTHAYGSQGQRTVTLTVGNGAGDTVTATKSVAVAPEPPVVTGISASPPSPEIGEPVTFTAAASGVIEGYAWQINDAPVPGTGPSIAYAFPTSGNFRVVVTATGPSGSSSFTLPVTVAEPPPPRISIQSVIPSQPEVGDLVTVTAAANTSPPQSGPINAWSISWGDGASGGPDSTTATTATFSHRYTTPGTFTVTVTATGPVKSDSASASVRVVPPPPPVLSGITASPSTGTTGQPIGFTPVLSGGAVSTYSWTVNGAVVGSGPTLSQTFPSAGTYTVGLTVTGPGGSDTASLPFAVVDPPTPATPVADNPTPIVGQTVTFTSGQVGSGPISSWAWQVNDSPIPGSSPSVAYTFPASGTYRITVIATGPSGAVGSASLRDFFVAPAPPPVLSGITASPSTGTAGQPTTFTPVLSGGAVSTYSWTVNGAVVGSGPTLSQTFPSANTYTVGLTVAGPGGSATASLAYVVVDPPPPPGP